MNENKVRNSLVDALHQNIEFVSGESISTELSISRTAVWKHIQMLKRDGYYIQTVRRKGYKLLGAPKDIHPLEIKRLLQTQYLGHSLLYYHELGSTNSKAQHMAETNQNLQEGTILIAQMQRSGRGRMDRSWLSPSGGIWASLILKPEFDMAEASLLTFAAAVAICAAVRRHTNLPTTVKWPNDVMCNERKLAGILAEVTAQAGKIKHVVLGFGINGNIRLSKFPQPLRSQATSLYRELHKDTCLNQILAEILLHLEENYELLKNGRKAELLDKWRECTCTLGHQVSIALPNNKTLTGLAQDITDQGALIVKDDDGQTHRLTSGDLSIRKMDQ